MWYMVYFCRKEGHGDSEWSQVWDWMYEQRNRINDSPEAEGGIPAESRDEETG